jgi:RND family efflux transporter MFP subunit
MTPNQTNTVNDVAPQTDVKTIREPQQAAKGNPYRNLALAIAIVAGLAAFIFYGIHSRASAEARLHAATDRSSILSVSVAYPKPSARTDELVLPGATQAFVDSPIFARTNGYLKRWYVDIGGRVRKGQLLAEIETPELDEQLQQAKAELATSEANLNLSQITSKRDENLLKTHSVSTQERDNAVNRYAADIASVQSNRANVARLEQLQSFERVVAPFDGVITVRKTDVGALIDSGANAPQELFHIVATNKLRVYVSVPEPYSRVAQPGAPAELTLDEFPGRTFHGTLVRTSDSIDYSSRTLLVEVDVDNPTRELMPGAYTRVHFKLPDNVRSLVVPANTLLFRKEGLQVGVVRSGKAELVNVKPGHDYGDSMEILSGLRANDAVILSPSDSLSNGTPVQISHAVAGASAQ